MLRKVIFAHWQLPIRIDVLTLKHSLNDVTFSGRNTVRNVSRTTCVTSNFGGPDVTCSLKIFYSINTNDIQHTFIVNIQRIRTKA